MNGENNQIYTYKKIKEEKKCSCCGIEFSMYLNKRNKARRIKKEKVLCNNCFFDTMQRRVS